MALACSAPAGAQDNSANSRTNIKSNDTRAISYTGCLRRSTAGAYELSDVIGPPPETSRARVPVDRDSAKTAAAAKTNHPDGAAGTTGTATVYDLTANEDIDLSQYVGKRIEIAAITPDPGRDGVGTNSGKKIELPRSALPHLTAVSVRAIAMRCTGY
jgi:hypothetical protein